MRGSSQDGAAEMPGSYVPVCTKLRAETSKIVGCVAEICHELETAPVLRRAQGNQATTGQDTDTNTGRVAAVEDQPGEASGTGSVQTSNVGARNEHAGVGGLRGQGRISGADSDLLEMISDAEKVEDGAQTQLKTAIVHEGMQLCADDVANGRQAEKTEGCKRCAEAESFSDETHLSVGECGEQYHHWSMLDLPVVPLDISDLGYSALTKGGEVRLRQIVAMGDKDAHDWNADVPDVWSCRKAYTDILERQCSSNIDEEPQAQNTPFRPCQLRRVQCEWCEIAKSSEAFHYHESSRLLKTIVRTNVQVKNIVVPNVFDGDWGFSPHGIFLPQSMKKSEGGVQHLLLPFDLVREDEDEVTNAPSKLISIASKYFHDLRQSDVSLTRASMNIPSVWNLTIAKSRLEALVAEEVAAVQLTPNVPATSNGTPIDLHLTRMATEVPNQEVLPSATINGDLNSIVSRDDHPLPISGKLTVTAEDNPLSTDYFLSDQFLRCNWSEPPEEIAPVDSAARKNTESNASEELAESNKLLQRIARPALWDLMRKKLLQVSGASLKSALGCVTLETLEAIIYAQYRAVKKMSLNPSAFSSADITEACASLRQAAWLHTLRIVSISHMPATNGKMMSAVLARILASAQYKLVLGASNWNDLHTFLKEIGGIAMPGEPLINSDLDSNRQVDSTAQPPLKKLRALHHQKETPPVRVLCSLRFLEQDELLDELCTEQQIFFIERDLPPPIDILVDERNCICVVTGATIQEEEANVRTFVFSLARLQVQFQKCWLIIALDTSPSVNLENVINLFYAALAQFRVEIQVFTCFSCEETGHCIRAIVDQCAEVALSCHRILPRLWFERPFLLEEESQFERFLVSTKIINHYAAQSLLHKICMDDLFLKSVDELKLLIQNAITDEQLQLLWGLVRQDHGLNNAAQKT
ncbi:hypothetical protein PF005_g5629 [Phytophthora fragariae]|uniref:Uncharacterized protein n=1 Tax=Phytophthora fragariae TaxID=53985 RepID=A0A6A4A0X5_9STRA|nr:hypothetical protein PF009_g6085 [Phytophthora fragariae]KAE9126993.1 hypothetical protein PF007_g5758 [Phytophthora fragariae]KAE9225168.1 hypothetical protein PF005_g5629 [Phytophthora fragariae]KAE9245945.1 hypothetical protein PF004_g5022 [Phytophthora fragariae]KAE9246403.1 hypothetical protein PF002_g6745 [Phytophthora fragariae]